MVCEDEYETRKSVELKLRSKSDSAIFPNWESPYSTIVVHLTNEERPDTHNNIPSSTAVYTYYHSKSLSTPHLPTVGCEPYFHCSFALKTDI